MAGEIVSSEELFGKETVSSEELFDSPQNGLLAEDKSFWKRLKENPPEVQFAGMLPIMSPKVKKRVPEIFKEEVAGGIQSMKEGFKSDSVTGSIPPKKKPIFTPAGMIESGKLMQGAKVAMGAMRTGWSPVTAITRGMSGEPAQRQAEAIGAPPLVSQGIGIGGEILPQLMIPAGLGRKAIQETAGPLFKRLAYGPRVNLPKPYTAGMAQKFEKITQGLKEWKPIRAEQEALYTKIRGQRIARVKKISEEVKSGKITAAEGLIRKKKALKGEMERISATKYQDIKKIFSDTDREEILQFLEKTPDLNDWERTQAQEGFSLLATGRGLPVESQMKLLQRVLPNDFIKVLTKRQYLLKKGVEAANVWRALLSSGDLSAGLRQAIFVAPRHPILFGRAFKSQFGYAFSERQFQKFMRKLRSEPLTGELERHGLAFTDLGGMGAEERFIGEAIAEQIPFIGRGVRGSSRAYTGMLNKLRYDIAKDFIKRNPAIMKTETGMKQLTAFINAGTGRGNLIKGFKQAQQILNAGFFSPRLISSRLKLLNPLYYANPKLNPAVRKEALQSLISFTTMGMTILALAKLRGAEVGTNWNSADFGKIKIGNTRIDVWGGFQQYIRVIAQLISGKMISSTTGREYRLGEGYRPTTRTDIVMRFMESKANPIVSFVMQLGRGTSFAGEEFDVPAEVINRMIPMVWQDMYDLYKEGGLKDVPWATPAVFGMGLQTYGKQIPTIELKRTGPKLKMRPVPDIGEDIMHQIRGTKPSPFPKEDWAMIEMQEKIRKESEYPKLDYQAQQRREMERLNKIFQETIGTR